MKDSKFKSHLKHVQAEVETIKEIAKEDKKKSREDILEHVDELHDYIKAVLKDI